MQNNLIAGLRIHCDKTNCYTSDRNVRLWLVQIASRGVS